MWGTQNFVRYFYRDDITGMGPRWRIPVRRVREPGLPPTLGRNRTVPSITTNDSVRLDYIEVGNPNGRPLVFIAGFKAEAASWLYQIEEFAQAGYRVLARAMRGHGTSEKPDWGHRMARRGMDLSNFLTTLDLREVTLVGQSMGGNTVWSYLGLYGTGRVSGVVIVDQTPKMLNTDDWEHGFYGYTRQTMGSTFERGIPGTGHGTPLLKRGRRLFRLFKAMKLRPSSFAPEPLTIGELALLNDSAQQDFRDVIQRLDVPALFVAGADSEVWPSSHAEAAASLNPLAYAEVISNAGHATNVEQPYEFNDLLRRFLALTR